MLIQSRQWVPVTSRLRVSFALRDEPGEFDVQADVRVVRQAEGQHTYRIHCKFLELARADAERIVRWTFREQIAQRGCLSHDCGRHCEAERTPIVRGEVDGRACGPASAPDRRHDGECYSPPNRHMDGLIRPRGGASWLRGLWRGYASST